VRVGGREYVRLADWARTNDLDWHWTRRDESFYLSNGSVRLQFALDSREARVNNVQVWMLFPLIFRDNAVYASQLDLETTLQPLAFPVQDRPGVKVQTICLDPGHGGKDPGNQVGSHDEKQFTLLLALELREQLRNAGFKVSLTRSTDTFVDLPDRPDVARQRRADLFVSLHFNATDTGRNEARGSEVYCLTPAGASSTNARGEGGGAGSFPGNRFNGKNLLLACQIQKALVSHLGVEDRGVRRARFAVLRDAAMPAVLIEAGFMTQKDFRPRLPPRNGTGDCRRHSRVQTRHRTRGLTVGCELRVTRCRLAGLTNAPTCDLKPSTCSQPGQCPIWL